MVGAALGASVVSGAWLGQERWKGMVTAQPALLSMPAERRELALTGFERCRVVVDPMPEALKDEASPEAVKEAVTARLKDAGVSVVTLEDQQRRFNNADMSHDEAALRATDELGHQVYVNVMAGRSASGHLTMIVEAQVIRGVFVWPGYSTEKPVWVRATMMILAEDSDPNARLMAAVNRLMDVFARDWKACNPD